jgi:diguanylate cyclase (GGDEF)-like protein
VALACAERITTALRRPYTLAGKTAHLSASVGIAVHAVPEETAAELERQADQALYAAKGSGRARCVLYEAHPALAAT